MIEVSVAPLDRSVSRDLDKARGWDAFERDLRAFLGELAAAAGATEFEVTDLFVGEPPTGPGRLLRNGTVLGVGDAIGTAVRMAAGRGPFCALVASGLRIENSWEGVTHLLLGSASLLNRVQSREALQIDQREALQSQESDEPLVDTVADEAFWCPVAESPARLKLLCERWAYGSHGARWYRLGGGNAFVVPPVEPRSLVSVLLDPETSLERLNIDEGFIALGPLDRPGEVAHEEFSLGADSLYEVGAKGWEHAVAQEATWAAVVPDRDGVIRAAWPSGTV